MKLLLFLALAVAVISAEDDRAEKLATAFQLGKEDVLTCINKISVTVDDINHFEQKMKDESQTIDVNDENLKMGCFYTCLCQKKGLMTGAQLNVDKFKELINSSTRQPGSFDPSSHILDTCAEQVKNETKECEVNLKYFVCMRNQIFHERQPGRATNNDK